MSSDQNLYSKIFKEEVLLLKNKFTSVVPILDKLLTFGQIS